METKLVLWITACMAFMLSFMYVTVSFIARFVQY
jgi:hypothetical protein